MNTELEKLIVALAKHIDRLESAFYMNTNHPAFDDKFNELIERFDLVTEQELDSREYVAEYDLPELPDAESIVTIDTTNEIKDDLYELTLRVDEIQLKLNSVINMFNGNVLKNVNSILMNGENK